MGDFEVVMRTAGTEYGFYLAGSRTRGYYHDIDVSEYVPDVFSETFAYYFVGEQTHRGVL